MKKVFKTRIFLIIVTAIIFTGIGAFASIAASSITYNGTTVDLALNDLYSRVNNQDNKICIHISGTKGSIGAKYACDPGDGNVRYFYILKVNTNDVEMIMEKNIVALTNHQTALAYFTTGAGTSIKNAWTNVENVGLPGAQEIADASDITGWDLSTATVDDWSYFGVNSQSDGNQRSNYQWLVEYTNGCSSNGCINNDNSTYGYWTKDLVANNNSSAWAADWNGDLNTSNVNNTQHRGIRPVITVLKSKI